jgi:hypothetical protein
MKNNRQFDNVLNLCLDRILKGETVERCLQSYPEMAQELEPLLRTAVAAKVASEVQPREEFKARAHYEFQSALREMETNKSHRSWFSGWRLQWQSGWAIALVAILIVIIGGGGTVLASSNSMPDSVLYPVKVATENVQMALTFSDIDKAELNAKLADKRVNEIVYMSAKGDPKEVQIIASRLNNNLMNINNLVMEKATSAANYGAEDAQRNIAQSGSGSNPSNDVAPSDTSQPMLAAGLATPSSESAPPTVTSATIAPKAVPAPTDATQKSSNDLLRVSPSPGATNVSNSPAFQWSTINDATGYEFQIADNPDFSSPFDIQVNLASNSWTSPKKLEYNKQYYWRVRALNMTNNTMGDWVQNTFTTETGMLVATLSPTQPPVTISVPSTATSQDSNDAHTGSSSDLEKLKQTIMKFALAHPARLEEALNQAPEEVRPALRQAITQAIADYDKLLKALANLRQPK